MSNSASVLSVKQQISYLGHTISTEGVSTEPSKIAAVVNWTTPTDVRESVVSWVLQSTTADSSGTSA